ncbi:MAG TPA: DUF1345 domain-containing protein [Candidatus Cybelea sp.]|nr:DUF1345 domain-containing protein [Candidatus Cybelea sp.]
MNASAPIARWGGTLGVLLLAGVALSFPRRYELGPPWEDTIFIITLLVVVLISVTSNLLRGPGRLSNAAILTVVGLMSAYNALALCQLVLFLLFPDANRTEIEGPRLLASGVSIWLTNVLTFALLYWEVDGGGPERRLRDPAGRRDFAFPGALTTPRYAEYLFLAFNTATAFSPTDTMPLTTRVRMMMMAESAVSLMALAIVAARAINIMH